MKKVALLFSIVLWDNFLLLGKHGLNETIMTMLGGGGNTAEVCQNIGKKGRLLSALPASTKKAILEKCERELLLGPYSKAAVQISESKYQNWIEQGDVHPQAWYAVSSDAHHASKDPARDALAMANSYTKSQPPLKVTNSTIDQEIFKILSSGNSTSEICNTIGQKGSALSSYSPGTKKVILGTCELEFLLGAPHRLGLLDAPISEEQYTYWSDQQDVFPSAWYAVSGDEHHLTKHPIKDALIRANRLKYLRIK